MYQSFIYILLCLKCYWFTKLYFFHNMLKSMHHGFSVCGMWQDINPHKQWELAVLLPSVLLQNILTVKMEVLWSWRYFIYWSTGNHLLTWMVSSLGRPHYVAKCVFTLTYFLHQYYPTVTSIYIMFLQT